SRERNYKQRAHPGTQRVVTWEQVPAKLRSVFDNTRLKIVNSDIPAGVSLDYNPRLTGGGKSLPPEDIYVIVVGGAKLSRGLTIEGLCISYFARAAPNPKDDTIQQMSRWLGYRGPYL